MAYAGQLAGLFLSCHLLTKQIDLHVTSHNSYNTSQSSISSPTPTRNVWSIHLVRRFVCWLGICSAVFFLHKCIGLRLIFPQVQAEASSFRLCILSCGDLHAEQKAIQHCCDSVTSSTFVVLLISVKETESRQMQCWIRAIDSMSIKWKLKYFITKYLIPIFLKGHTGLWQSLFLIICLLSYLKSSHYSIIWSQCYLSPKVSECIRKTCLKAVTIMWPFSQYTLFQICYI